MVGFIKKFFWKIQDIMSSIYLRAEIDFWFHVLIVLLLVAIIYILLTKGG